jgi:hypothetical protein
MQKGFAHLLIVLVVLGTVVLGLYFFFSFSGKPQLISLSSDNNNNSQSSASPATQLLKQLAASNSSTQTDHKYVNTLLGFELTLTSDLIAKEDSEGAFNKRAAGADIKNGDLRQNFSSYVGYQPGEVLGAVAILDKTGSFDSAPLQIWVFNNPDNLTIDQWYENYWYYPFIWGDFSKEGRANEAPAEDLSLPGLGAKSAIVDYQPSKPKFGYIFKDQKVYLFKVIGNGDQVLSSFKLL